MLRWLRSKLSVLSADGRESGDGSEGTFRPSELDASVLYAHGADVNRLEDELAEIEDEARALEEARRQE